MSADPVSSPRMAGEMDDEERAQDVMAGVHEAVRVLEEERWRFHYEYEAAVKIGADSSMFYLAGREVLWNMARRLEATGPECLRRLLVPRTGRKVLR